MTALMDYLTSAGVDSVAASWGCVIAFSIILIGIVSIICRICSPRKH